MSTAGYTLLNVVLALLWMILNRQAAIYHFIAGYVIGFLMLWLFQHLLRSAGYVRKTLALLRFLAVFAWLFVQSNFSVAYIIMTLHRRRLQPSLYPFPIEGMTPVEALLLSQCITLTPGTVSVKLDESVLWVHFIDLRDEAAARRGLDELRQLIVGFMR